MRTAVAIIAVVSFFVAIRADLHLCRCGLFTTGQHGEYIVTELPGIDVPSCEYKHTCEGRCIDEYKNLTSKGNLYATSPTGTGTVGQLLCDHIPYPIDQSLLYLYSEICNGPWRYSGEHTMQMLCCDKDGNQYACT
ncbi:uncharacterized protein LOC143034350 [Oratosquilla oratoria]|uniref:uncharacterized protein LOC143034350 n=1 Tax=Oratosquilla oratoria TaxID=337810 RepID=UPI003F76FB5F